MVSVTEIDEKIRLKEKNFFIFIKESRIEIKCNIRLWDSPKKKTRTLNWEKIVFDFIECSFFQL